MADMRALPEKISSRSIVFPPERSAVIDGVVTMQPDG